jgi:hypothetical protein
MAQIKQKMGLLLMGFLIISFSNVIAITTVKAEDMNNPILLTPGLTVGQINDTNTEDWYYFSGGYKFVYVVLTGMSTDLDMEVYLYNTTTSNWELFHLCDNSGTLNEEFMAYMVGYSGDIILHIIRATTETSDYNLILYFDDITSLSNYVSGETSGSNPWDLYYFTSQDFEFHEIALTNLNQDLILNVYLFEPSDYSTVLLYSSDNPYTLNEVLDFDWFATNENPATFIVEVGSTSNVSTYELYHQSAPISFINPGPNNGWAIPSSPSFYIYYPSSTQSVRLYLGQLEDDADLMVYLWDTSISRYVGIEFSANSGNSSEFIEFLAESGQKYLISIQGSAITPYVLYCIEDDWIDNEPNDIPPQATPYSTAGYGYLSSITDVDIYTISVNAGDIIYIRVTDADSEIGLALADSSLNPLDMRQSDTGEVSIIYQATVSETLYFAPSAPTNTLYRIEIIPLNPAQVQWGVSQGDELKYYFGYTEPDFILLDIILSVDGFYNTEDFDYVLGNMSMYYDSVLYNSQYGLFFRSNLTWMDYGSFEGMLCYFLSYSQDGMPHFIIPYMSGAVNWTWLEESAELIKILSGAITSSATLNGNNLSISSDFGTYTEYEIYYYYDNGTLAFSKSMRDGALITYVIRDNFYTPLSVSTPSDFQYVFGQTGNTITWTVQGFEFVEPKFELFKDGVSIQNGTWTSGANIIINVDGLTPGVYNYTIVVKDGVLGNLSDTVFVTVTSPNLIITTPNDITYTYGQTGYSISWTVTGYDGSSSYQILRNGTSIASGSWTSGTPITRSVDGLNPGIYNYTIIASDGQGSEVRDMVIVTVNTPSMTITNPADISYTYGQTGYSISWTVTGYSGSSSLQVLRNGTQVLAGGWTSGIPIMVSVDGLSPGIYNYTIIASDGYGKQVIDMVIVTVNSPSMTITHPADITYTYGQTGNSISWTVTGYDGSSSYQILRNGTSIFSGSWTSGSPITRSVDGLNPGSYNYTIIASDGHGKQVSDTVIVNVDAPPMSINDLDYVSFEMYETGYVIPWVIQGYDGLATYQVYQNNSQVASGSWVNGVSIDYSLDYLTPGLYNLTIKAQDGFGHSVEDTVWVEVTAPAMDISKPDDIDIVALTTGNTIDWIILGYSGPSSNAALYRNGTLVASKPWMHNETCSFSIDGLAPGIYNFTIVANDSYGSEIQDTVFVYVFVPDVTITSPPNIEYTFGQSGYFITWIITGWDDSSNYSIYVNDVLVKNGSWVNNASLIYSVDGFPMGIYNVTIIASDKYGNGVSDMVVVLVKEPPPPPAQEPPSENPPAEEPTPEAPSGISGYPISVLALSVSLGIALMMRKKRFEK